MSGSRFLRRWGKPLLMALLTIFGLLSALLGSGIWQMLSWITLSLPLLTLAKYIFK